MEDIRFWTLCLWKAKAMLKVCHLISEIYFQKNHVQQRII